MATVTAQIAQHLNVIESAIVRVESWANVLFCVVKGLGARFVSKKVVKVSTQVRRSTWKYGDNYELVINGEVAESWSTNDFTLNGFLVTFARKYELDKDSIEICNGVDNTPRKTVPNHQSLLAVNPPATPAWDPREQSNDFDPDEVRP